MSPRLLLDARGVLCPVPIIRLARTARQAAAGDTIVLLSDDPAAAHDVPAWCRLRGHDLVASDRMDPDSPRLAALLAGGDVLVPSGAEPHVPNPRPAQVLVHVVQVR